MTRKPILIDPYSPLSPGDTDMPNVTGVSHSLAFSFVRSCVETLHHRRRSDSRANVIVLITYPQGSRWHGYDTQGQRCWHALFSLCAIYWTESFLHRRILAITHVPWPRNTYRA